MMTKNERKERQKIRQELRDKGILPPVKPRINRKKYATEIMSAWRSNEIRWMDVAKAIELFLPHYKDGVVGTEKITDEHMVALRIIHLAKAETEFEGKLAMEGRTTYSGKEWLENVYRTVYPDDPVIPIPKEVK